MRIQLADSESSSTSLGEGSYASTGRGGERRGGTYDVPVAGRRLHDLVLVGAWADDFMTL